MTNEADLPALHRHIERSPTGNWPCRPDKTVPTSKYTDMHRRMGCGTYFIFRPMIE